MKQKSTKILVILIALILIVGAIMIGVKGLAFELKYQNGKQVEIDLGKEFDIKDMQSITNEVFGKQAVLIEQIEVYKDAANIITTDITLLHAVALGHFHVVDAARNLRRGFVGGALHRALNQRRGPFGEVPADQYDREDDDRCGRQNSDYVASFHIVCLLSISYCLRGPTGRNVKPVLSRSNFRFLSRRREPPARRCGARRTDIRR